MRIGTLGLSPGIVYWRAFAQNFRATGAGKLSKNEAVEMGRLMARRNSFSSASSSEKTNGKLNLRRRIPWTS